MPRATTAACEVMPPRAVRMPLATLMPRRSSGEVSWRTRITCLPLRAQSSASSAKNTICPVAAPGDAGRPCAIERAFLIAVGSKIGCRSSLSRSGLTRRSASFSSIIPWRSMSIAIRTIAAPVRLPLRVCSIQRLPSWIVNSTSCMSA